MKWHKRGLILAPDITKWWSQKYCILPTPVHLEESGVVRVFFATTCAENFGRITYVDLDENNLSRIVHNPHRYILDTGMPGAFDDCGVNPSCILRKENQWLLYYAGYQRHFKAPFSILSGLALSGNGTDYSRYSHVPILERTHDELNLRSAPSVIYDEGIYKMWYVSSLGWETIAGEVHHNKLMPTYCLRSCESHDGIHWGKPSAPVFLPQGDEFGFGRPWIYKKEDSGAYLLFYSIRRRSKSYRIGYAISADGKNWQRKDDMQGLDVSPSGWDSEMVCYPAVIRVKGRTILFYNGNNNGATGFGYAELMEQ